jgi:uncharacterized protein YbjQ (UPF0145 family)
MMPFPPPPKSDEEAAEIAKQVQTEPAPAQEMDEEDDVLVTTGNAVAGYRIRRYLGVVRGIVVRAPSIGQGLLGSIQQIVGGNIEAYREVCESARQEAFHRMVDHAVEIGADAVIGMRYDATEFASGVTEVLAYGTAVQLRRRKARRALRQSNVAISPTLGGT